MTPYHYAIMLRKIHLCFCIHSMIVLLCELSQKTVWKIYYGSVVRTVSTVSGRAKHLTFIIAASYVKRCSSCDTFQDYSLSSWRFLSHVDSCSRTRDTLGNRINCHQAPLNKLIALGTNTFLEGFSWFLDIFYLQALAICIHEIIWEGVELSMDDQSWIP